MKMLHTPFYDPNKSYEENFEKGPFGAFADDIVIKELPVQSSALNRGEVGGYDYLRRRCLRR